MRSDSYGRTILCENDLIALCMRGAPLSKKPLLIDFECKFDDYIELESIPNLVKIIEETDSIETFDQQCQSKWEMPESYYTIDIVDIILNKCSTDEELQRAAEELLIYQERDMFTLLKYLVYLVDTMRSNNIVWGVGRGSSVSSYVLYLLGVHKINSLKYQLDISEFLK